jgi:hypothetical protein
MNKSISKVVSFVFFLTILSCNGGNVNKPWLIKGVVVDSQTRMIVPNARVTMLCWRKVGFEEETYDKIDTTADEKGAFEVRFPEGIKVDIGSIAANYLPAVKVVNERGKTGNIELQLKRNESSGTIRNMGQLPLFVRNFYVKSSIASKYFGIDILNGVNTASRDSSDIYLMPDDNVNLPRRLVANENGGIYPIMKNGANDQIDAPLNGYVKRYQLTGNEQGFFVKCRNGKTFARIQIFSLEYDRTSPFESGYFKDFGIMFDITLQTEGNKFGYPADLRLDHYILERI